MTTDYNKIAKQYREVKERPWRSLVEEYSMLKLIGALEGKKVVDLACGEGFFTRKLKLNGAATVVGTDLSKEMIALAIDREQAKSLGINYFVEDVRATGPQLDYDLAIAAWLLVYAHDREELAAICRGLSRQLRSGGRLVTLTTNPQLYFFDHFDYQKYGFHIQLEVHVREGALIRWSGRLKDSTLLEVDNYYLPEEAYASALEDAGFGDVVFHQLSLSPDAADEADYWADMINKPPAIMIEAIKT